MYRFRMLAILTLLGAGILAACTSGNTESLEMAPESILPERLREAPLRVQEAYRFAIANPDLMQQIPCYCGCAAAGHTSNYDCYVSGTNADGSVVIDTHGLG
ncbi:MAG: PCYCGC motif-containing (lipo)protein [Anaerolineales bacterium]